MSPMQKSQKLDATLFTLRFHCWTHVIGESRRKSMMTGSGFPSTWNCIRPPSRKAALFILMLFGTRHAFLDGPSPMSDASCTIMAQLSCTLAMYFAILGTTVALRTKHLSFAQSQHAICTIGHWQASSPRSFRSCGMTSGSSHEIGNVVGHGRRRGELVVFLFRCLVHSSRWMEHQQPLRLSALTTA
jgi:hypothetical protein